MAELPIYGLSQASKVVSAAVDRYQNGVQEDNKALLMFQLQEAARSARYETERAAQTKDENDKIKNQAVWQMQLEILKHKNALELKQHETPKFKEVDTVENGKHVKKFLPESDLIGKTFPAYDAPKEGKTPTPASDFTPEEKRQFDVQTEGIDSDIKSAENKMSVWEKNLEIANASGGKTDDGKGNVWTSEGLTQKIQEFKDEIKTLRDKRNSVFDTYTFDWNAKAVGTSMPDMTMREYYAARLRAFGNADTPQNRSAFIQSMKGLQ